ncbi:hypothetical protein HID58_087300 [Brassica napus]|uniref:Uncharacterized protein n=1 Tax=Brassica napus TaxID=3708 RepID=A0ABQ7XSV9_BRANA|nr:hypothetical protein HID58_087300 [Brassica napus]
MALEKYGPHHPTIIESKHIKNLYELWGIDYTVGIEAPEDGENLETVRPGYCGAYTSHFQDGEPFGSAPMTPELRGLIATLRRGSPRWLAFTVDRIRAAYTLPPGENRATPVGSVVPVRPGKGHRDKRAREKEVLPARSDESSEVGSPVSIAVPVDGARRAPNASTGSVGDQALNDDIDSSTHRCRRRSLEEINSVNSNSPSSELPLPYELLAKAMEASNEYAGLVEKHLADFSSKVEVGSHLLTIQQLRGELETVRVTEKQRVVEVEGLKGKLVATEVEKSCSSSLAQEYDAVLAVVKDKLWKKKEETTAEIRLQEVRARIEALTEYSEGGFELEEELGRLKDREISLDLDYGVASVSDPSLSRLDLPEVSGDLVDQE